MSQVSFASRDVDGVKVVVCEHDAKKMSLVRAILSIRVGESDESIPYRGVSSIAIRMAIQDCNWTVDMKWAVDSSMSLVEIIGEEDNVLGALRHLCSRLGSLPWDCLEDARRAELEETSGQTMSTSQMMLAARYDFMTYGLNGSPSTGARQLTPDMLSWWVATYFARGNIVLTLSDDVADTESLGSALDMLPQGGYRPALDAQRTKQRPLPRHVVCADHMVYFNGLVPRSATAMVAEDLMSTRLRDILRTKMGLAYSPFMSRKTLDGPTTLLIAGAELPPEATLDGARIFLHTIERSCHDISDDETQRSVETIVAELSTMEGPHPLLAATAERALFGQPMLSLSEHFQSVQNVSRADVLAYMTAAWDTRITASPSHGARAAYANYTGPGISDDVPTGSTAVISDWHPQLNVLLEIHDIGIVAADKPPGDKVVLGKFADIRWALSYDQRVIELSFADSSSIALDTRALRNGGAWWAELLRRIPENMRAHQGQFLG